MKYFITLFICFSLALLLIGCMGDTEYYTESATEKTEPCEETADISTVFTTKEETTEAVTTKEVPKVTEPILEYKLHRKVPILMYHEVNYEVHNSLYLSVDNFKAHLDYFEKAGITPISMKQLTDHWQKKTPLPEKPIVLTFDDGYRSMYTIVYPLLLERGWSGTFYCISGNCESAEHLTEEMIKEMADGGMEIGSHTVSHANLKELSGDALQNETASSKAALEDITGKAVTQFSFPYGKVSNAARNEVKNAGYACAVTTEWGFATSNQLPYKLKRLSIDSEITAARLKSILSKIGY